MKRARRALDGLDDDIRDHIERETQDNIDRGMSPDEAHRHAMLKFGNLALIREDTRAVWGWGTVERLAQDCRYAARALRKSPGFTAMAVLSLALGIAVNTAMFSVINGVLLQTVPFPEPERLVRVVQQNTRREITVPEYQFVKEQGRAFASVAAYRGGGERRLEAPGVEVWVAALAVSTNFLETFGRPPVVGREFTVEETRVGGPQAVMISEGLWRSSFGADAGAVGTSINLNGDAFTVVGVLPAEFSLPQPVDVLVPLRPTGGLSDLGANSQVVARLASDVSFQRAQAEVGGMTEGLRHAQGGNVTRNYRGLSVLSYHDWLVGDVRTNLVLLFAATGIVLLISCANVAMLLLTRTAARAKEIGVRLALGAGRRMLLQFLIENLVIAAVGAVLGVLAAYGLLRGLIDWAPFTLPGSAAVTVDTTVLAFAVAVSLATAVIFTLVPLSGTRRLNVAACLQSEGRSAGAGTVRTRTRNVLVVSEVALATVLLIASWLLIQSLYRLQQERLGFAPQALATFETPFAPERANNPAERLAFIRALLTQLEQIPGVERVAATNVLPLAGQSNLPAEHDGHPDHAIGGMEVRPVTAAFFGVMGIPIRHGRSFGETDASRPVVIVNETVARRWWAATNPLGDRLTIGRIQGREFFKDASREVVGVVADTKSASLQAPTRPTVYVPMTDAFGSGSLAWVVKINGRVDVAAQVRAAVAAVDSAQRVRQVRTMNEIVARSSARSRFNARLFGVFAGVALLLAALGLYGVLSFLVAHRRQEIGTRMALGASKHDVLRAVLRQGLTLTLLGLGIGVGGALLVSRWLTSLLFGVTATDPISFAAVSFVLLVVSSAASYVPARRAAAIDPMAAMRSH
jgi:putative ABC transport system permease protein